MKSSSALRADYFAAIRLLRNASLFFEASRRMYCASLSNGSGPAVVTADFGVATRAHVYYESALDVALAARVAYYGARPPVISVPFPETVHGTALYTARAFILPL